MLNVLDLDPGAVVTVIHQQSKDLANPPTSVPQLLDILEREGLSQSIAALRGLLFDS